MMDLGRSEGSIDAGSDTLVSRRARELWIAHGRPPEGEAIFLHQARQEVQMNNRVLVAYEEFRRSGMMLHIRSLDDSR